MSKSREQQAMSSKRQPDEQGSVLLLILGLGLVLVSLVAVVVDVSAVALAKRGVASVADGAASAAAQGVDGVALFEVGLAEGIPLDPEAVRQAVAAYQQTTAPGISLSVTVDGAAATITATRQVRLPLRAPGGPAQTTVTAVAMVRSPVVAP